MEESAMVYESARPHLNKLAAIAQELNAASDAFTEELKGIERDLAKLNVGIEVEVGLKNGDTRVDPDDGRPYETRWLLGYKKLGDEWRVAVTEYVIYNPNAPENVIDRSARPEWRLVNEKPLLQASRELRIAAADKVEELLAAITKAAAERVASLRKVTDARPTEAASGKRRDVRLALAELLDSQAGWRSEKAREYPDDNRNECAADAMQALADYVRQLPSDDQRLRDLDSISMGDVDVFTVSWDALPVSPEQNGLDSEESENSFDFEEFHRQESEMWGRIGFDDRGTSTPSEYLDGIVAFYKTALDHEIDADDSAVTGEPSEVPNANDSEPRTHEVVYEKPARQHRKRQITSDGGLAARIARDGLGDYASDLMKRGAPRGSSRGKKASK